MMVRISNDVATTAGVPRQCAEYIIQLADRRIPAMEVFRVYRHDGNLRVGPDPVHLARAAAIVLSATPL